VARRRALTRRFSAKATIWRQMTSSPMQVPLLAYGTGTANRFQPRFRRCDGPPKVRPSCQERPTGRTRSRGVAIMDGATVSVAVVASRTEAEFDRRHAAQSRRNSSGVGR
jgi:hypothetical protein